MAAEAHGGRRKGAGRRPGSLSTKTRKIAEEAMAQGATPLEVMLANMRFAHEGAQSILNQIAKMMADGGESPVAKFDAYKEMLNLRAMAQEAAKDAAPYMHPRLAAIEHTGADGGPMVIVSKAQRDAAVAAAMRADS